MTDDIKPNLFDFLSRLSKGDVKYLQSLPEEHLKSFAPLVIMRWLTGTTDKKQIRYLKCQVTENR